MITEEAIEEFEAWMLKKGHSPVTVGNAVRYLRMLFIKNRRPFDHWGEKHARWALRRFEEFQKDFGVEG